MLLPKEKLGYTTTYQGRTSEAGWLVLNIANLDLEGVSKIYIDLSDVEEVKSRKSKESEALEKARKLLGGE